MDRLHIGTNSASDAYTTNLGYIEIRVEYFEIIRDMLNHSVDSVVILRIAGKS